MRAALCIPVLVLSLLAAAWAVAHGMAGEQFQQSAKSLWAYRKQPDLTGKHPDQAALTALEQDTVRALDWAPSYGQLWISQVLIARTPREAVGGAVVENLPLARQAAEAALVRLPHSPIAWAEYALIADLLHSQQLLPGGAAQVQHVMRRALALGPREPNMILVMLDLGLRNWDEMSAESRAALEKAVAALNSTNKRVAVAIALRRGRDGELCALTAMRSHAACAPPAPAPGAVR